jgi:uncharacterized RDD family membrane protein YckC
VSDPLFVAPAMSELQKLKVDTRVVVETPEGVDFQFLISGPGSRAWAWAVDMLLKGAIIAVLYILALLFGFLFYPNAQATNRGGRLAEGILLVCTFVLDWFYGSFFEAWMNGQTPGKKYAGLRVVRTNGTPVDLTSAMGRNFLRTVDMLPLLYTIGLISMLMTRRMQRLGDLVFDTMVVDERREWISRTGGLIAHSEPLIRAECPRRFSVPERTLTVIERLFEPDRIISEARREEIARPLSEALRHRLGYQDPQPDPRNPHTFFRTQGFRHTAFLLRVLKTFAEDPTGARRAAENSSGPDNSGWSPAA